MLISVLGLGSIWSRRVRRNDAGMPAFESRRCAYYNTTGVLSGGKLRNRPRLYGFTRFNGASGCRPDCPEEILGRVFDCEPLCTWNGIPKVLFKQKLGSPEQPHAYLAVLKSADIGAVVATDSWLSPDATAISFSECGALQEVMLVVPAFGWIRSTRGNLFLEPLPGRPWLAKWIPSAV